MKQIVPLNKQSKKKQKEFHDKQRGSWNGLSPVTRTVPNGKAYDRNKTKREGQEQYSLILKKSRGLRLILLSSRLFGGPGWTRTNAGLTGAFTVRCHCH